MIQFPQKKLGKIISSQIFWTTSSNSPTSKRLDSIYSNSGNQNKTPARHRDIFRETLLEKKVWRRRGSNSRPTGWETKKSTIGPGSNTGRTT